MISEIQSNQLWKAISQYWDWIVAAIIILAAAAIRVHLLDVPMERDEGEYAYAGQLILQGIPPYAQVYNMKLPGTYAAYALILSVFGETVVAVHLGLLIVNAATALLLFLLGKKLFGAFAGLATAATFALLSIGQPVQGIFANSEHFVILPAIGGILLLVYAVESQKLSILLAAAVLLGIGFIMKQHGAAFIAFGGVYLFFKEISKRPLEWRALTTKCLVFIAGALLPFAIACLLLLQAGVFAKFWFWTVDYASQYVSSIPFSIGMRRLEYQLETIVGSAILVWIIAAIGLVSPIWNKRSRDNVLFSSLFLIFSFLALVPGFYFRPHYFILFLPAVALFAGIGASSFYGLVIREKTIPALRVVPVLLILLVLIHGGWQQRQFLFFTDSLQASRLTYGRNPFPESLEIARFIKDNSNENDRIAVIGSEPQIYFYSNRRSATGHIYTYALMEAHPYALSMQKEMIREIESAKPRYLIYINVGASWLRRKSSKRLIFDWFGHYSRKHYELAGIVDIGKNGTTYLWEEDAIRYRPESRTYVRIFRRKD
jgi:hypothetical protein